MLRLLFVLALSAFILLVVSAVDWVFGIGLIGTVFGLIVGLMGAVLGVMAGVFGVLMGLFGVILGLGSILIIPALIVMGVFFLFKLA